MIPVPVLGYSRVAIPTALEADILKRWAADERHNDARERTGMYIEAHSVPSFLVASIRDERIIIEVS